MKFARLIPFFCIIFPGLAWANIDPASTHLSPPLQNELPFTVYSSNNNNRLSADVSGVVEWSFDEATTALTNPARWCEFIPLNPNIKSCTFKVTNQKHSLTFYAGRKKYQSPEDAYPLNFEFQVETLKQDLMKVSLSAKEGPLGTSNHQIVIEVKPDPAGIHINIHSSFTSSLASRLGTELYLATLGRDKVGFTVTSQSPEGKPIYIKGVRGVIERNVMRYYLALKAFFNTRHISRQERFENRIQTWFDLSENYATQLRELKRDGYLQAKRQERQNQIKLQSQLP